MVHRCVSSVSIYLTTDSLIVNETNTSSLSRVRTINETSVLVPSPGITRGRRCRGTVTLIRGSTTHIVRRGSLASRGLVSRFSSLITSHRALMELNEGTGGVTIRGSSTVVYSVVRGLTRGGWRLSFPGRATLRGVGGNCLFLWKIYVC